MASDYKYPVTTEYHPKFTAKSQAVIPILHQLFCQCGRELTLPQGKWHEREEFLWHYKCECGIEMQSKMHFPRIEYEINNTDGSVTRISSSGYPVK